MIGPYTLAALAAALCADALHRLVYDDNALALLRLKHLFQWLTWSPLHGRLYDVFRFTANAEETLIPSRYANLARHRLYGQHQDGWSSVHYDAARDKELTELAQFRVSMLRHLPPTTVMAFGPRLFTDLATVRIPALAWLVPMEVIHTAEHVLQAIPVHLRAREPLYLALMSAKAACLISTGPLRSRRQQDSQGISASA